MASFKNFKGAIYMYQVNTVQNKMQLQMYVRLTMKDANLFMVDL